MSFNIFEPWRDAEAHAARLEEEYRKYGTGNCESCGKTVWHDEHFCSECMEIVNAKTGKVVFASGDALEGHADTNRTRLIRTCNKIGLPLDDVAMEYGLTEKSTEKRFGIALNNIMKRYGNGR